MSAFEALVNTSEQRDARVLLEIAAHPDGGDVVLVIGTNGVMIRVVTTPAMLRGLAQQLRSVADTAERTQDAAAVWRRDAG